MAEKTHTLTYNGNLLTVSGVTKVVEITEKEAQLKLENTTLQIKGNALNVVRLDRAQGIVALESASIASLIYRQNLGIKGIFG